MIYLDVTSAASSPVNMGVHRTVRGIYQNLTASSGFKVIPLRWDFKRQHYARLSQRELGFLENPFAAYQSSPDPLGFSILKGWCAAMQDSCSRPERGLDLNAVMRQEDVLLIPDLSWDQRIKKWEELSQLPGKKIAVFHDAMPLNIPGQSGSNDALFKEYVKALGYLDQVICISQEVHNDLLKYWNEFGIKAKPAPVLIWPVPFTGLRPDNQSNQKSQHIIYVARLKLRKNHLVLLEACELLWKKKIRFSLDLIGVEDAFFDTLTISKRIKELAAKGYPVKWRKHISDQELSQAYQAAAFTVFPSKMEGFGLPILESLWHGRPVICGGNGAIGEVAEGGGCHVLKDQNNPVELAEAIQKLLQDEKVYEELYAQTQKRKFRSWEDYGQELKTVLEESVIESNS